MSAGRDIPSALAQAVFHRVLAEDLTDELRGALAGAGLDVAALAAAVPRGTWERALELTAQALFPGAPADDGLRRLGRHLVDVLPQRGLVKKAWLSMARLLGPRRALKQGAGLKSDSSPVAVTVVDRGSHEVEVHVDDGRQPQLLAGLLEGLVALLGGKDVRVLVASVQPHGSVLVASWR